MSLLTETSNVTNNPKKSHLDTHKHFTILENMLFSTDGFNLTIGFVLCLQSVRFFVGHASNLQKHLQKISKFLLYC